MVVSLIDVLDHVDTQIDISDDDEIPMIYEHSPYCDDDTLINTLKDKTDNFKILSLNIQSLHSKFDLLKLFLDNFLNSGCEFSAVCLQETWLKDFHDLSLLQIKGYNLVTRLPSCSVHGGVCIYLKDNLNYRILDLSGNSDIWDGQFLEVNVNENSPNQNFQNLKPNKKLVIGNIYRPPRNNIENLRTFVNDINTVLDKLQNLRCEAIILGDFNIDLLKLNEKEYVQDYFEAFLSNGFIPKITFPTRVTDHSSTLIDNAFVKISTDYSKTTAGILKHRLSDHHPYFVSLDYIKLKETSCRYIEIYPNDNASLNRFRSAVNDLNLSSKLNMSNNTDPNCNYKIFSTHLNDAIKIYLPIKRVRYNRHKHKHSKWITSGILNSIRYRDKLYDKLHKTSTDSPEYITRKVNLQTYNRILKQNIRHAKKSYFHQCFEKFKSDIKQTWNTIKDILNKHKPTNSLPDYFTINDRPVTDLPTIVNEFNNYFTNIGPTLATKIIPPSGKSYRDYLKSPCPHNFSFSNVDSNDIKKIIDKLKNKSTSGHDNLSNKLLKTIKNEIAEPLSIMINEALNTGIFPDELKIAKVLPIHKKGDIHLFSNYRPISILPSVSKVYERVVHNQLHKHFQDLKLYYNSQYGFRTKHSTELAALELIDRTIKSLDQNECPINIYLDLSKAFDTLDHEILLSKLDYYGIRDKAHDLLRSYLTNRKQFTQCNNKSSDPLIITTGVPQGSILGPLLFIIYINDISKVSNSFYPIVYADDTTLSATLGTFGPVKDQRKKINTELGKISDWLKLNKLSLNINKTKAMIFRTPQKTVQPPTIEIDNTPIEFVHEFNFLGIIIDQHLTWNAHIKYIRNKLSKVAAVLTKLKNFLPKPTLLTLYNSMFLPHINYGLLLWGSGSESIFNLQKRALRIINNSNYNAHTEPLFKSTKLLKIKDLCTLQELKFCHRLENKSLPQYFYPIFTKNSETHDHNTRGLSDYTIPLFRHTFVKRTIRYRIPSAYNSLSDQLRDKIKTHSISNFAKSVKYHILETYRFSCPIQNCYNCQL